MCCPRYQAGAQLPRESTMLGWMARKRASSLAGKELSPNLYTPCSHATKQAAVVFHTNLLCLSPWGFLLLQAGDCTVPFDPLSPFCLSKSSMLLETGLPPSSAWHLTPFCGPQCRQARHGGLLRGSQQHNWLGGPGRDSCQVPRTARQHPLAPHRSEPSQEEMLGKHIYYSFNHKPIFAFS